MNIHQFVTNSIVDPQHLWQSAVKRLIIQSSAVSHALREGTEKEKRGVIRL